MTSCRLNRPCRRKRPDRPCKSCRLNRPVDHVSYVNRPCRQIDLVGHMDNVNNANQITCPR